jgi:ectoine hydroxylase-related dioxygenase (phytanoyl-CoA dioxygenase family)
MNFERDGAEQISGALDEAALTVVEAALGALPKNRPGVRISNCPKLQPLLLAATGTIGKVAARWLGSSCRPVRAILFDKSVGANWALSWHQDRTIAVVERAETPGFGPWTVKAGIHHVEPPIELLERMLTLRLHLDHVDSDNAPLLIAPGSHRYGRVAENHIACTIERCGIHACLADRGDLWAYSTLILHASEAARRPRRRRVLQVDYSAADLPAGLQFHFL